MIINAQIACVWEATARKVGNVHRYTDFAATSYLDFVMSAIAIGAAGTAEPQMRSIGHRVLATVEATRQLVGQNTNLGIILLLAPLMAVNGYESFDVGIQRILSELTVADARDVYRAIRIANPGCLGSTSEQDVQDEPTVTLLDAMRLASDRDFIARQYANNYADIINFGVPVLLKAAAKYGMIEAAIIECQLQWLARYPDSLIARKCSDIVAEHVRRQAECVLLLGGLETVAGRAAGVALDAYLRSDGNRLNPGTTADLVTACLFVVLREGMVKVTDRFRWDAEGWL